MPPQAPHICRMKGFAGQSAALCTRLWQRVQNKLDETMVAIVDCYQRDELLRMLSGDRKR